MYKMTEKRKLCKLPKYIVNGIHSGIKITGTFAGWTFRVRNEKQQWYPSVNKVNKQKT